MYLAWERHTTGARFFIRASFYSEATCTFSYRNIFDLGMRPSDFIEEYDNGSVVFDEALITSLKNEGEKNPDSLLEEMLFSFFSSDAQAFHLKHPARKNITISPLSAEEKTKIDSQLHIFDLRRLYYLRYSAVDQRHLHKMHKKLCRPLLDTCRDEKEFYFRDQELRLPPRELKTYVFAIFDLQRHFTQSFAAHMPQGLPENEIEELFITEICSLNKHEEFFGDPQTVETLHRHLQRYVVMFFDFFFPEMSYERDFIHQFMGGHRRFTWPVTSQKIDESEYAELFGLSKQKLVNLTKSELTRLYRKRAKTLHPDQGGEHSQFILLTEAYNLLLYQLRSRGGAK